MDMIADRVIQARKDGWQDEVDGRRTNRTPTPDVLDELAAAVIETGGSARQIAGDLMPDQYLVAAKQWYPPPPT
jgi:hypothetical protein